MEYFDIKSPNIFTQFNFMNVKLNKSPNPKNYLIELTMDIANKILRNMDCNQVQPFIKLNDYYFFFHPWLIDFFGSTTSLIEFLCNFKLNHSQHSVEFALDPYKYKSEIDIIDMRLEKISGIFYDIEVIIKRLNRKSNPIISVFFDPELMDPEQITDPHQKIKALERRLNSIGGGRWPIRVVIDFLNREHDEIHFNIYEYSHLKKEPFHLCRSLHGIYKISARCFTHIDGKILGYEEKEYEPYQLVFEKNPKRPACKLFRVDGGLPETVFVMFSTLFFYNNDIILEFFEIDNLDTFLLKNNELE